MFTQDEIPITKLNDDELVKELHDSLKEYKYWVNMKWTLSFGDEEDVFPIITIRDDIHDTIIEIDNRSLPFDPSKLKKLDEAWQQHLIHSMQKNYTLKISRDDKPKTNWWWWIDQLLVLSSEEKATL